VLSTLRLLIAWFSPMSDDNIATTSGLVIGVLRSTRPRSYSRTNIVSVLGACDATCAAVAPWRCRLSSDGAVSGPSVSLSLLSRASLSAARGDGDPEPMSCWSTCPRQRDAHIAQIMCSSTSVPHQRLAAHALPAYHARRRLAF
jgi:hypothetical protein